MSDAETIARKLWDALDRDAGVRGTWELFAPLSREKWVAAVQSLLDDGTITAKAHDA